MDKYYIPKYLNEPFKIVFFTIDELIVLLIPVFLSLFYINGPVLGIVIGTLFVSILKRIKGNEGHNQLLRFIYWNFPPIINFKSTPHSNIREIIG